MFPILSPPPSSLPIPSLWVVPVHQPQASSIVHRTWTGNSFHTWNSPPRRFSFKSCREGTELGPRKGGAASVGHAHVGVAGAGDTRSRSPPNPLRKRDWGRNYHVRLTSSPPRRVVLTWLPWRWLRCFTSGFVQFVVFSLQTPWASPPISRCTTTVARRGTGLSPARSSWRGCGPTPTANSNAKRWRTGR